MIDVLIPFASTEDQLLKTISHCVQSTSEQLRFVVVDDRPLDFQKKCAFEEVWDVVYLKTSGRCGITNALNIGLRACQSQFVARVDAGDLPISDRFKSQRVYLQKNPDIAVVGGQICQDGDVISARGFDTDNPVRIDKTSLFHSTVMFNRFKLGNFLIYDEFYKLSQDKALWFKLHKEGFKGACIGKVVLHYQFKSKKRKPFRRLYYNFTISRKYRVKFGLLLSLKVFCYSNLRRSIKIVTKK
ncbi:glycosyltransferase family 2 protein [Planktomarina temperata]|nr:glycosyltransferase family 2 protein [Planktomarina temperata]